MVQRVISLPFHIPILNQESQMSFASESLHVNFMKYKISPPLIFGVLSPLNVFLGSFLFIRLHVSISLKKAKVHRRQGEKKSQEGFPWHFHL